MVQCIKQPLRLILMKKSKVSLIITLGQKIDNKVSILKTKEKEKQSATI